MYFCTYNKSMEDESIPATGMILPEAGHPFQIVNPCSNFGFKKAFHNKDVLIDFLNNIFDYDNANKIIDITYVDKDFPSEETFERSFVVDMVCQARSNRYILIEMHNDYTENYADKAYVEFARYLSRIDGEKLHDLGTESRKRRRIGGKDVEAKDFWQKIEEVCTIVISNKRSDPDNMKQKYVNESMAEPDVINTYEMLNKTYPNRHLGNLEAKVVLIMLANFKKTEDELVTDTDRWLFALKDERLSSAKAKMDLYKDVSDIEKATSGSVPLRRFYAHLYPRNIREDLLTRYEKKFQLSNEIFALYIAEAEARGVAEARDTTLRIAKSLKDAGSEPTVIALHTGLSLEEIQLL